MHKNCVFKTQEWQFVKGYSENDVILIEKDNTHNLSMHTLSEEFNDSELISSILGNGLINRKIIHDI